MAAPIARGCGMVNILNRHVIILNMIVLILRKKGRVDIW
jgi:hypothetical protein